MTRSKNIKSSQTILEIRALIKRKKQFSKRKKKKKNQLERLLKINWIKKSVKISYQHFKSIRLHTESLSKNFFKYKQKKQIFTIDHSVLTSLKMPF
jgi:hypothetical protein